MFRVKKAVAVVSLGLASGTATAWIPDTGESLPVRPEDRTPVLAPCGVAEAKPGAAELPGILAMIGLRCPEAPLDPITIAETESVYVVDEAACGAVFNNWKEPDGTEFWRLDLAGPIDRVTDEKGTEDGDDPTGVYEQALVHGDNIPGTLLMIPVDQQSQAFVKILAFMQRTHFEICNELHR